MIHARSRAMNVGWLLALVSGCALAAVVACGTDGTSTFGDEDAGNGSGDGGGNNGNGFGNGNGNGADATTVPLRIDPPTATLTITDRGVVNTQVFVAKSGDEAKPVTAAWSLDDFTAGSIDGAGKFTAKGGVATTVKVTATYGGATATATLTITTRLKQDLGNVTLPDGTVISQNAASISGPNRTALDGTPTADSTTNPTKIVYPYEGTVMPRGLLAPVPQFTAGANAPQDFKVSLDTSGFHWEGYGHVASPTALRAGMPQDIWADALLSAQPDPTTQKRTVTISIVKASNGVAYGPATTQIVVAPASLTGVIYYSSYSENQITMGGGGGGTDFGLWSVKPGTTDPPTHLNTGCVICHSVSANGRVLTTGADPGVQGSGVYSTTGTSTTKIALPPNGLQGDTRNLSWGVLSPDGAYALRSRRDFWGGDILLAWKTPDPAVAADAGAPTALAAEVPVVGTNIKTYVPSFSTDGKKLVYVNADGAYGATSRSVGIMDVAINPAAQSDGGAPNGTITLSNPRTIFDTTATGSTPASYYTRVPTFLPDSASVVLQETIGSAWNGFNGMLPNWTGTAHVYSPGALYILRPTTGGKYENVELALANAGSTPSIATANYEPKPLPVQAGGYFWVVFTSVRADGLNGAARKKLWVTAISPNTPAGTDPSHPPFLLTNQSIVPTQECERGYWSVDPCRSDGASCATGDDCCGGFCRPQNDADPQSPLVCRKPATVTCASVGDRCRAGHNEDCCNAGTGVVCIGGLGGFGTCAVPGPR